MTRPGPGSPWYGATRDAATVPPEVAERALEWLVELQEIDVPAALVDEWTRWRAAHPDHERAWQRIEAVRGRLQPLASPLRSAIAQAALAPPRSDARRRAIKALAVLAFAGGAAWSVAEYTPWRQWSADYRTDIGQRREVVLSDGTRLVLNTDSAVDVRFDAAERRVRLVAGEIFIATAVDALPSPRPFLVETAQGTARALGTEYVVRQFETDTEVSVFQGAVQIRPRHATGEPFLLRAGHHASYTDRAVAAPDAANDTRVAWKDGFIVARSMRLDDFLVELGRYTPDALSCDPAIAGLRVSGSFPVGEVGQVLQALVATLDVRIDSEQRLWRRKLVRLVPGPGTGRG